MAISTAGTRAVRSTRREVEFLNLGAMAALPMSGGRRGRGVSTKAVAAVYKARVSADAIFSTARENGTDPLGVYARQWRELLEPLAGLAEIAAATTQRSFVAAPDPLGFLPVIDHPSPVSRQRFLIPSDQGYVITGIFGEGFAKDVDAAIRTLGEAVHSGDPATLAKRWPAVAKRMSWALEFAAGSVGPMPAVANVGMSFYAPRDADPSVFTGRQVAAAAFAAIGRGIIGRSQISQLQPFEVVPLEPGRPYPQPRVQNEAPPRSRTFELHGFFEPLGTRRWLTPARAMHVLSERLEEQDDALGVREVPSNYLERRHRLVLAARSQ